MPNLSKRLQTIASLVPKGARVCDIGTDHGYLSIELMSSNKCASVIATDINSKPLSRAEKNIKLAGVEGISLRLCDGLSGIKKGEADCIVIAGMGAEVISKILEDSKDFTKNEFLTFIFQPTTSPEILREYLSENGFLIEKEIPIFENGKIYSVMLVRFDGKIREMPLFWYFTGDLTYTAEDGKKYIEKQFLRCFKCMKSLETTEQKEKYIYYKTVCDEFLSHFGELENGI